MSDASPNEPGWTRNIPNKDICGYFKLISMVALIIGSTVVLLSAYLLVTCKGSMKPYFLGMLIGNLISVTIVYYLYLFAYLTCARSLKV
jgi:hypothetical protein